MVEQADLVLMIDEALERFGSRDIVASSEIVDLLLDLRLAVLATPEALERMLHAEREPAAN